MTQCPNTQRCQLARGEVCYFFHFKLILFFFLHGKSDALLEACEHISLTSENNNNKNRQSISMKGLGFSDIAVSDFRRREDESGHQGKMSETSLILGPGFCLRRLPMDCALLQFVLSLTPIRGQVSIH